MNPHLTTSEARAVLSLSANPNWAVFKDYVYRLYELERKQCETLKDDVRFSQGKALALSDMAKIEAKAKNILEGQ